MKIISFKPSPFTKYKNAIIILFINQIKSEVCIEDGLKLHLHKHGFTLTQLTTVFKSVSKSRCFGGV